MTRCLIALDIDGTLIDTSASFTRIVKELSGASDDDIWRFRDTGGFNDDWELARACTTWIRAGRPDIFAGLTSWQDVVARCDVPGADPGDLAPRCIALYRGGYWRNEAPLLDGALLHALARRHRLAACTGRDRWEIERAEELLGYSFMSRTTMEDARKPDPEALLRLLHDDDELVLLLGDTEADRQCAQRARQALMQRSPAIDVHYQHVTAATPARDLLFALAHADDARAVLAALPPP